MAAYLGGEAVAPALVLCSTALRARQTLEALSLQGEVGHEDDLYGASAADLLARLRRVPDEIGSVMVVGHNPGLHELAVSCSGKGDPLQLARLRGKLPTGALVRLSFLGPWASLAPGHATLESLVVPGDL
jgi:phosphohistidine phosphatase